MFDADRWSEIDDSSMIKALGVRDDYLIVKFQRGMVYRYAGAAQYMDDLLAAESVGKYFHQHVIGFPSQRISGEEWPDLD